MTTVYTSTQGLVMPESLIAFKPMSDNTEALDIAAGTIAVVELARKIGLYIYSLAGRHEFLRDIAFQVAGVQVLLGHLRHFDLVQEAEATWSPLKSALERLEARLRLLSTSRNPLIHAWPQHEEEITRLLAISQSATPKVLKIAEEVHELVQESRKRGLREIAWRTTEPERAETLAWLTKLSFTSEHAELQRRWVPGTAVWLQDEPSFIGWTASKRAEIMLVLGSPGCGKTMLASQLVTHFSENSRSAFGDNLAYIFCSSKQPAQRNPAELAASLLQQLCQSTSVTHESVMKLRAAYRDYPSARPSLKEIERVLISVIQGIRSPCCLVIDGFDECDHAPELAKMLYGLMSSQIPNSTLKIVVFSRPSCEALTYFGATTLTVQITPESNQQDITKFAYHKLEKMIEDNPILSNEQLRSQIVQTLLSRADGMFLWVDLQAENLLTKPTVTHLREALKQLAHGIDKVFERSLQRIRGRPDEVRQIAVHTLQWARFGERPLHIEDMREAVAIEDGLTRLSTDDMVPGAKLISYCADLVLLDQKGYVQMLHSSLKQVLQGNWAEHPLLKDLASSMVQDPETHLADCCLSYLLLDDFDLQDQMTNRTVEGLVQVHPFLPYAARFWAVHVRRVAGGVELLKEKVIKLITHRTRMSLLLFVVEIYDNPSSNVSIARDRNALHFIAENGLQELFVHFEEDMEFRSGARDSMGMKPLDLALKSGHHDATLFLLEQHMKRWQTKQDSGLCRLHLAVQYGWQDVVDAMLTLRAILSDVNERGMASLHVASSRECAPSILQTLRDAGADVEQVTVQDHNTSLMLAAEAGAFESVIVLLDHRASVHRGNKFGQTALHFACRNGNLAIVKAIVEVSDPANCLVNMAENEGEAPMFEATWCGYGEVVDLLLEYGASTKHTNNAGQTVFHVAAGRVQKEIFVRLLQHDANFACRDAYDWDPLDIISLMHFDDVIQRLKATIMDGALAASALTQLEQAWNNRSDEQELREWVGADLEHAETVAVAVNAWLRSPSHLGGIQRRRLGRDESSLTFLHVAAATSCYSVIMRAIECPDIDLFPWDKWGRTPYDLAIGEHNSKTRSLLRNAASACQVKQEQDTHPELINLAN